MGFMDDAGIIRKPPFFDNLRLNDWSPRFHWEDTSGQAADAINVPHEDYPHRVRDTQSAIEMVMDQLHHVDQPVITQDLIRSVHRQMFPDHGDRAGKWRQVNVTVATHVPPKWEWMNNMMAELEHHYRPLPLDYETLRKWYYDFETIHPLRDGNGRTGGVILAAISFPINRKFLTPGQ